jgi:hypothetical protein
MSKFLVIYDQRVCSKTFQVGPPCIQTQVLNNSVMLNFQNLSQIRHKADSQGNRWLNVFKHFSLCRRLKRIKQKKKKKESKIKHILKQPSFLKSICDNI